MLAQLFGAVLAGAVNLAVWSTTISHFEAAQDLAGGRTTMPGCVRTAMLFGQYFPNPGIFPQGVESRPAPVVTALHAMLVEALGTFVLVLVIFLLIDRCNTAVHPAVVPPAIGATVAALIAVFAPQSQAGWNPARDLGPRIVAWAAGWGASALPGPGGGFWIYLVGPCVGSLLAGAVFFGALRISDDECENEKCK